MANPIFRIPARCVAEYQNFITQQLDRALELVHLLLGGGLGAKVPLSSLVDLGPFLARVGTAYQKHVRDLSKRTSGGQRSALAIQWATAAAAASSSTGGGSASPWVGAVRRSGEAALAALRAEHGLELELFSFEAVEAEGRLAIALDKPENPYGSPSLDDIALFSKVLRARLELTLGAELAGRVEVEVSSPGADRCLRLPGDLRRFAGLPLLVKYQGVGDAQETGEPGAASPPTVREDVLALVGLDEAAGTAEWELADVRANKRRRNSKAARKKRAGGPVPGEPFTLPLAHLVEARIHIDI